MPDVTDFLTYVAKEGYANKEAPIQILADGSHDLVIEKDGLRFHDNWFGGEPFGGREVISKGGKVFWMMTYFGALVDAEEKVAEVYGTALKEAMRQPAAAMPVRGPKDYTASNGYRYTFAWHGDLHRFTGVEKIANPKGLFVYQAEVSGGTVDQD